MMKPIPFPGCAWVSDTLLVGGVEGYTVELPAAIVEGLTAASVSCIINLLSKDQFRAAGPDALWGGLVPSSDPATARQKVNIIVTYCFWSAGEDGLPTARQVRLTLDDIDAAHATNQIVFVNGAGHATRAVIAAGCWLARHGSGDQNDPGTARLGWLEHAPETARGTLRALSLNEAERAFVCTWPSGAGAEPVRTPMELLDDEEVYPTATVEHWLRVLPTARCSPDGRHANRRADVPVLEGQRVSNGADIRLELADLLAGTWIGERTLRLLDGSVVVFISPHREKT